MPYFKSVRDLLAANWQAVQNASEAELVSMLTELIEDYVAEATRKHDELMFRIHWDGDFFSTEYAGAWATVCRAFPQVQFWVYTRSFTPKLNVVPVISGVQNLTVYLSADKDNMQYVAAALVSAKGPVRVATLADTAAEAKSMLPSTTGKSIVPCPEVVGKLPLVYDGKGACAACRLCIDGRKDVGFAISKQ